MCYLKYLIPIDKVHGQDEIFVNKLKNQLAISCKQKLKNTKMKNTKLPIFSCGLQTIQLLLHELFYQSSPLVLINNWYEIQRLIFLQGQSGS